MARALHPRRARAAAHRQSPEGRGGRRQATPDQLFVTSFAALIAAGTAALALVPGTTHGAPLTWIDALFTATSAVCVTGLVVVDTATVLTPLGQGIVLVLIQPGGLGMITFTSMIILALGRRLSLRQEAAAVSAPKGTPEVGRRRLVRDIVLFTLVIEAVAAVVLTAAWAPRFGVGAALWHAVFHAVSAFCNAGFSTFSDSLAGFRDAPLVLGVTMLLIVGGGLGFLTLEELWQHGLRRTSPRLRLTLHSRLVLWTTGSLLLAGWMAFALFEWDRTLAPLAPAGRLMNALFMSVTARTAGFNTVDYALTAESTNFLTVLLMTVGGSPGSTAGGLKVTTFALIGLLAWSRFRGREVVSLGGRSVRDETVQRAVGLAVAYATVAAAGVFCFVTIEQSTPLRPELGSHRFLSHLFEVVSAFNTVGLSMGVTGGLTSSGKVLLVILMFVGRVGPLTFAAALARRRRTGPGRFRWAYEDVVVG